MKKQRVVFLIFIAILAVVGIYSIARAQTGNPFDPFAGVSPAKATFIAQSTAQAATEMAMPKVAKGPTITLDPNASCPMTPPPLGISPFTVGPFPGGRNMKNSGVLRSNAGFIYELWVGAPDDNSAQGLIRVQNDDPDWCASMVKGKLFQTIKDYTGTDGPYTLTKIEGDVIVFTTASGVTGRFNVVTGKFLQ